MSFRYIIETENPIVIDGNKMYNCTDGKLRLKIVEANPWHTGVPIEKGVYACRMDNEYARWLILVWTGDKWKIDGCEQYLEADHNVLRWQKIADVEEATDRRRYDNRRSKTS